MAGSPPDERPHPREDFFHVKRLGHVVVRARVDAGHLVAPAVAGGQDQHGHRARRAAPALQHADAVHLGQADVEDHGVVGLGIAEVVPLLAVEGAVHHVARLLQRFAELAVEVAVVFHDEYAHSRSVIQAGQASPAALPAALREGR